MINFIIWGLSHETEWIVISAFCCLVSVGVSWLIFIITLFNIGLWPLAWVVFLTPTAIMWRKLWGIYQGGRGDEQQ